MKHLWIRFLCRYYYRYRIYHAIKDFVNNSPAQYRYIRYHELGNGVALYPLKINKRYSSQRAEIVIERHDSTEWSLRYSFWRYWG